MRQESADNYEAEEICRGEVSPPPSVLRASCPCHPSAQPARLWTVLSWTWDSMSSFPVSQAAWGTAIPVTGSFQMSPCQHHSSRTNGHWKPALPSWHENGSTSDSCEVRELGKTAKGGKTRILQTLRNRFRFAFKLKLLFLAERESKTTAKHFQKSYAGLWLQKSMAVL